MHLSGVKLHLVMHLKCSALRQHQPNAKSLFDTKSNLPNCCPTQNGINWNIIVGYFSPASHQRKHNEPMISSIFLWVSMWIPMGIPHPNYGCMGISTFMLWMVCTICSDMDIHWGIGMDISISKDIRMWLSNICIDRTICDYDCHHDIRS